MSIETDRRDAIRLKQRYADLEALGTVLTVDYLRARAATSESGDPYSWRMFVRTMFASADATLFAYRQYILAAYEDGLFSLAPHEVAALKEQRHRVRDNGRVKVESDAAAFLPTLRLTVSVAERFCTVSGLIDFGGDGWEAFRNSKAIRDRLTHPKSTSDLMIKQADKDLIVAAADWFGLCEVYLAAAFWCRFTEEEYGIVRVRELAHEIADRPDTLQLWLRSLSA